MLLVSCGLIWSHLISQSSSKDTAQLFAALHHRILALRSMSGQESDGQPAIRFSDDDKSRTPPTAATPAPGNISYWYQTYGCGIKCMVSRNLYSSHSEVIWFMFKIHKSCIFFLVLQNLLKSNKKLIHIKKNIYIYIYRECYLYLFI